MNRFGNGDFGLRESAWVIESAPKPLTREDIAADVAAFLAKGGKVDYPQPVQLRAVRRDGRVDSDTTRQWAVGGAPASLIWCNTRNAAKRQGQQYYRTGKPCPNGHMAVRYTSSGICQACAASDRVKAKTWAKRQVAA